jgi:uncharacterized protein involved in exopolysaccharide biosynthesis
MKMEGTLSFIDRPLARRHLDSLEAKEMQLASEVKALNRRLAQSKAKIPNITKRLSEIEADLTQRLGVEGKEHVSEVEIVETRVLNDMKSRLEKLEKESVSKAAGSATSKTKVGVLGLI